MFISLNELIIRGIAAALLIAISYLPFYYYADKLFRFNLRLKNNHPYLFKIIGIYEKNLYNQAKWVKNFRRIIVLFTILGYSILVFVLYLNLERVK